MLRDLKWFFSLKKRDFDNEAIISEIADVFKYAASKASAQQPLTGGEKQPRKLPSLDKVKSETVSFMEKHCGVLWGPEEIAEAAYLTIKKLGNFV